MRLSDLSRTNAFALPQAGWIRAIRDALGMTAEDLGRRMGVRGATVGSMEKNERTGGIQLSTLRRAAEAMDCELVYAFKPKESLEQTVQYRAHLVVSSQHRRVNQTMELENQKVSESHQNYDDEIKDLITSGRLWSDEKQK